MKLRTDIMSRLVGVQAANYKGEFMGRIVEVKYDKIEGKAQYILVEKAELARTPLENRHSNQGNNNQNYG